MCHNPLCEELGTDQYVVDGEDVHYCRRCARAFRGGRLEGKR